MMLDPPVEKLLNKVDGNRYVLCMIAGQRVRQIMSGAEPLVEVKSNNVLTKVVHEIAAGKYGEVELPIIYRSKMAEWAENL